MAITPLTDKKGNSLTGAPEQGESTLEHLFPQPVVVTYQHKVIVDGVTKIETGVVNILPFTFDMLPEVIRVSAPFFEEFKTLAENKQKLKELKERLDAKSFSKDMTKVLDFIVKYHKAISEFISVFAEIPLPVAEKLSQESVINLFLSCIEVNLDFFIQRLVPATADLAVRGARVLLRIGSQQSSSLSTTDTPEAK